MSPLNCCFALHKGGSSPHLYSVPSPATLQFALAHLGILQLGRGWLSKYLSLQPGSPEAASQEQGPQHGSDDQVPDSEHDGRQCGFQGPHG